MTMNSHKRDVYINAYRRTKDLERTMSARLRSEILVPYFGGCGCRIHNCLVAWETRPGSEGADHAKLAKLAKRYFYEQRRIWDITGKLADSFARNF
jgi:hypothetical protein